MTMTGDFAKRARGRVADVRSIVSAFRSQSSETLRQVTKIQKAFAADRERLLEQLGSLANDVVEKLPGEATSADAAQARVLQAQIEDLAASIEDLAFAESALDDLRGAISDTLSEIYTALKATETHVAAVERGGTKIGI